MHDLSSLRIVEQSKQNNFHFLAWRKLAECNGIMFDESLLENIVGRSEEYILDALLQFAHRHFDEDEKRRIIDECRHYYCDYIGL